MDHHYRGNLSADLRQAIAKLVFDGSLSAGSRVNEVHLAARLEVSRTPLREALTQLVSDGLLCAVPRRGFFVPELSAREVEELYPLRGILDPEALRLAGVPSAATLRKLTRLNSEIEAAADDPARVVDLDDRWHRELVANCGNSILLGIIEQIIARSRRYELAYLREQAHVEVATGEHEAILEALRQGDMEAACKALQHNMSSAREPLLSWLRLRQSHDSKTETQT